MKEKENLHWKTEKRKKFSNLKKASISESGHCFYGDWNQSCDWFL